MKKIILSLLLLAATICHSKTIEQGWNCFEGYIGENDVVVNIYCDSIGNLTGDYCYKKYETRIPLKGKLTAQGLFLDEFTANKITAKFSGTINEKDNTIGGKWLSTKHSDIHFFLRLNSQTGNLPDAKYELEADDELVESFFKNAKKAILTDNKTWLSKNIKFPIAVNIGKKRVQIKTPKSFAANYSKIITKEYQSKIKASCTCNIFSNAQGAMIGNGSLWVFALPKDKLKITAINN